MDRIGRYEVIRELGHGGMGSVYLGRDPELRRSVALKLLHQENTDFALKQEARTLAALNHPGIVTIFEIGEHEGRQFIAMEYLAGSSLRHLLTSATPSRDELVAICAKVARAVDAAHQAGILHRDIKPENVVVGEHGVVKVVDFGIARRLQGDSLAGQVADPGNRADAVARTLRFFAQNDTAVTAATQTVFGTPAYMAPEVLMGDPAREPSDVYSLGVMLYECLAGRRPHEAPLLHEVIARVIDNAPHPRLGDPLADFVERMLAYEPAARPALAEIAATLERTEAPVVPAPRRRAWPFVVAGVAVVAAGAFAAWRLARHEAPPPVVDAQPARAPVAQLGAIAIRPFEVSFQSWGSEPPNTTALADVVAMLMRDVGIVTIPPRQIADELQRTPDLDAAARTLEATYVVEGKLVEAAGMVDARLTMRRLGTTEQHVIDQRVASVAELPQLLAALATALAGKLDPTLRDAPTLELRRTRAQTFFDTGVLWKTDRDWASARIYFEQAVVLDPRFAAAWQELASVRGWIMAPQAMTEDAIERAYTLAPAGVQKQIWLGARHYYKGEFTQALAILQPLQQAKLSEHDRRDVDYYLAESYWHDGDHEQGVKNFQRIYEADKKFKPAIVHLAEYAGARRLDFAREMSAALQLDLAPARFSAGEYEALADGDAFPTNLYAQIVLERPRRTEDTVDSLGRDIYLIARAVERGDRPTAQRVFATRWSETKQRAVTDGLVYELEILGEVLLCAELADELRELLRVIAASSSPRAQRALHRLATLAAPLLGTQTPARDGMIKRYRALAAAIDAELAGDRRAAAAALGALVRDPTSSWDYPERAALARNLQALRKKQELRVLCKDTLRPAVFRPAFMPLRATCRRLAR